MAVVSVPSGIAGAPPFTLCSPVPPFLDAHAHEAALSLGFDLGGSGAASMSDLAELAASRGWASARECLSDPWTCSAEGEKNRAALALCFASALRDCAQKPARLTVRCVTLESVPLLAGVLHFGATGLGALCMCDRLEAGDVAWAEEGGGGPRTRDGMLAALAPLAYATSLRSFSVLQTSGDTSGAGLSQWVGAISAVAPPCLRRLDLEAFCASERWESDFPRRLWRLDVYSADERLCRGMGDRIVRSCGASLRELYLELDTFAEAAAAGATARAVGELLSGLPRLLKLDVDARGKALTSSSWRAIGAMHDLRELRLRRVGCEAGYEDALGAMLHGGLRRLAVLEIANLARGSGAPFGVVSRLLRSAAHLPALGSLTVTHVFASDASQPDVLGAMAEITAALLTLAARGRLSRLVLDGLPLSRPMLCQLALGIGTHLTSALETLALGGFSWTSGGTGKGASGGGGSEGGPGESSDLALQSVVDALAGCWRLRSLQIYCGSEVCYSDHDEDARLSQVVLRLAHLPFLAVLLGFISPPFEPQLSPTRFPRTWEAMALRRRLLARDAASWGVVSAGLLCRQERRLRHGTVSALPTADLFPTSTVYLLPAVALRLVGSFVRNPETRLVVS